MYPGKEKSQETFSLRRDLIQIKKHSREMAGMEPAPISAAGPTIQRSQQNIRPVLTSRRITDIKRFLRLLYLYLTNFPFICTRLILGGQRVWQNK